MLRIKLEGRQERVEDMKKLLIHELCKDKPSMFTVTLLYEQMINAYLEADEIKKEIKLKESKNEKIR